MAQKLCRYFLTGYTVHLLFNLIPERRIRQRDNRRNHFLYRQLRQRSKQNRPCNRY